VEYAIHYFPIQIVKTIDLPPDNKYIFAIHPHGVMPWPIFPIGRGRQWQKEFPGMRVRSLCASVNFQIPITREALLWIGAIDASWPVARAALAQGSSLSVFPGGSQELLESTPGTNIIVLNNRKGFVRLAIETGTSLVPVYAFGANDLYLQISSAKEFRKWALKKTRIAFSWAWGRSYHHLLPMKRPLYIVIGKPIAVTQNPQPTEEEIDRVHQQYVKELVELFELWKEKLGFGDQELQIL